MTAIGFAMTFMGAWGINFFSEWERAKFGISIITLAIGVILMAVGVAIKLWELMP